MTELTEKEIGYIAGFVDGEGCIGISKRKHQNKFGEWVGYSGGINISNTNLEVLVWIKNIFKVSSNIVEKRQKGNRKKAFALFLNKAQSQSLLKVIIDCLIVKKRQAEVFLLFCENSKDKIIREECWLSLKNLNMRGIFDVQRL